MLAQKIIKKKRVLADQKPKYTWGAYQHITNNGQAQVRLIKKFWQGGSSAARNSKVGGE